MPAIETPARENCDICTESSKVRIRGRCGRGPVLRDAGSLGGMRTGKGRIASLQWNPGVPGVICMGDASLAGDSLSSQDLCCGTAEAVALGRGAYGPDAWVT